MIDYQARNARIIALYQTGLSSSQVAMKIGVTRDCVRGVMRRAGMSRAEKAERRQPKPKVPCKGCSAPTRGDSRTGLCLVCYAATKAHGDRIRRGATPWPRGRAVICPLPGFCVRNAHAVEAYHMTESVMLRQMREAGL